MAETIDPKLAPLAALIQARGGSITPRKLQHAKGCYRASAQLAKDALEQLVTAELAEWLPDGRTLKLLPHATRELHRRVTGQEPVTAGAWTGARGDASSRASSAAAAVDDSNTRLQGIGAIPPGWPPLPPNASLQAEVGWVQSNRLVVVEQRPSGAIQVHLERAYEPAPSMAALAWLETSIRSYAKYVDVVARSLASAQDEQDQVRRERLAISEIEGLLQEALDESGTMRSGCATCTHTYRRKPMPARTPRQT